MSFDAFAESPSFSSDLTWLMHGNVTPCSQTRITGRGQSLDKSLHNKNENRKGSSDAEWKKRKHYAICAIAFDIPFWQNRAFKPVTE